MQEMVSKTPHYWILSKKSSQFEKDPIVQVWDSLKTNTNKGEGLG
jgi:hypothetical protein